MKYLAFTTMLALSPILWAQTPPTSPPDPPSQEQDQSQEVLIEKIFTLRDEKAFSAALTEAAQKDISEQVLLEARFLFFVDLQDHEALAHLSKEFLERKDSFNVDESKIFALEDDWLAVVHYTQAMQALVEQDEATFKQHITEAFWLSPRQAPAFAPHIEKLHLDKAMAEVKVKAERSFPNIIDDGSTTFAELSAKHPAVLLHFWSPWSRELDLSLPDFIATAKQCKQHNIAVVSVLSETVPEVKEDAIDFIKEAGDDIPTLWVNDSTKNSLVHLLRVQNLPTMVLVAKDGSILFNGAPSDDAMWEAFAKVASDFKRPETDTQ